MCYFLNGCDNDKIHVNKTLNIYSKSTEWHSIQIENKFRTVGFCGEWKTAGEPGKKPLEQGREAII